MKNYFLKYPNDIIKKIAIKYSYFKSHKSYNFSASMPKHLQNLQ